MYLTHNIHRAHDPSQGRGTSLCKDARHASLALSLSTDAMLTYHAIKHAGRLLTCLKMDDMPALQRALHTAPIGAWPVVALILLSHSTLKLAAVSVVSYNQTGFQNSDRNCFSPNDTCMPVHFILDSRHVLVGTPSTDPIAKHNSNPDLAPF